MWLFIYFRELPALLPAFTGQPDLLSGGATTILGLSLLLLLALLAAALAPGKLRDFHVGLPGAAPLVSFVVVAVAGFIALYGPVALGSMLGTPSQSTDFGMGKNLASDLMLVIAIGAIGPVAEEFAYRAVLIRSMSDGLSRWVKPRLAGAIAIVGSALIFTIAHTGAPLWHQLAYFLFALVLGAGYYWTGSLMVPLVPHLLNNAYVAFVMAQGAGSPLVTVAALLCPVIGVGLALGIGRLLRSPVEGAASTSA